ncbi:MAG TPA: IS1380 family transposase [Kineosporiaceae bacterium]
MPFGLQGWDLRRSLSCRQKGTRSVSVRACRPKRSGRAKSARSPRRRRVRIGKPDPALTASAGVVAVTELDRVLGLVRSLDEYLPGFKERDRGLTGGQTLTAIASCQLAGGDHLVSLDRRRADVAGQELEPVPTPASTTVAGLAKRFTDEMFTGIETAIAAVNARTLGLVGQVRASALTRQVTLDIDATDIEVYGPTKAGAAYNYQGQRAYRADIVLWAELGVPLAADLLAGDDDPRSSVVALIERTHANLISALPDLATGTSSGNTSSGNRSGKVALRMDAGYFAADAAIAADGLGIEFAIGVKRNQAVWRAAAAVPDHQYVPVIGMDHTEVAVIPYAPKGWPKQIVCLARRTRIRADQVSRDPRARKRRTIPKDQLALALDGHLDHVYGYSFILTNKTVHAPHGTPDDRTLDTVDPDTVDAELLAEVEHWYRHRTDIEALNKDGKHGAALRHMPSADKTVNRVWMWAALLATAVSAWIQELSGIDRGNGRGRRTIARLRRELINIPARVIHPGRTTVLRPPPGPNLLRVVLPRLQALPTG